jgi:hypothetical protein
MAVLFGEPLLLCQNLQVYETQVSVGVAAALGHTHN